MTDAEFPHDRPPVAKPDEETGVLEVLADAAGRNIGHVQVTQDPEDGVVRRPDGVQHQGRRRARFSAAAVATARGESSQPIVRRDGAQIGRRLVPTDGSTNSSSTGPKLSDPPEEVSAIDVMNGEIDLALRDKIVFIGATDPPRRPAARASPTSRVGSPVCSSTPTLPTRCSPRRTSNR